jgi:hypothetical protein
LRISQIGEIGPFGLADRFAFQDIDGNLGTIGTDTQSPRAGVKRLVVRHELESSAYERVIRPSLPCPAFPGGKIVVVV